MNVLINGIGGRMGKEVAALCAEGCRGARLVFGVDPTLEGGSTVPVAKSFSEVPVGMDVDCIIDFSTHSTVTELLRFARERKIPAVIATTGHTEEERAAILAAAEEIPVFFSANMSLGVALLVELARSAAAAMPNAEIEIVEKHHSRKLDAPSGTALMLYNAIQEVRPNATKKLGRAGVGKRTTDEIGIHSVRMGNIIGEHEVIICTQNETLTLKHEAHSRALFAEGALCAAEFTVKMEAGLYDMKSLVSGR